MLDDRFHEEPGEPDRDDSVRTPGEGSVRSPSLPTSTPGDAEAAAEPDEPTPSEDKLAVTFVPPADRLVDAERRGLRMALACRTAIVALAFVWMAGVSFAYDGMLDWVRLGTVGLFMVFGFLAVLVTGTAMERWWIKYAVFGGDVLGLCVLFATVPVSLADDVPQIVAFRAYGICFMFPLVALTALSLSWKLVIWTGAVASVGWWIAFAFIVAGMERTLSWGDLPRDATVADYETVFLSIDFIGIGNRIEETGMLFASALIMSLAVFQARRTLVSQLYAEVGRERERRKRERIGRLLGRYVPRQIADRMVRTGASLKPQTRHGAVLVLDVAGFTAFAADKPPEEVIRVLNLFLAASSDVIARHGGVVITFMGDGLLATFNLPLETAQPERAARDFVPVARHAGFDIRVGLAAGPIAAGSVGSKERQAFTVYGRTVNLAARLEELGKPLGKSILVDERIAERAGRRCTSRGLHELTGFEQPVPVFSVPEPDAPASTRSPTKASGGARMVEAADEPTPTPAQIAVPAKPLK